MNPSPYYLYNTEFLASHLATANNEAKANRVNLRYAFKANHDPLVLKEVLNEGLHLDCVSGFEIKTALQAGFKPEQICFAGVGKSDREIRYALEQRIAYFNIESLQELHLVNQFAGSLGLKANVCLRVNPLIKANTHQKISTAKPGDKFGIEETSLPEAFRILRFAENLNWLGFHFHIGSQLSNLNDYQALVCSVQSLVNRTKRSHGMPSILNLGGGLGIDYQTRNGENPPDFKSYFNLISTGLKDYGCQLEVELGRSLVAESACLITEVLFTKSSNGRNLAILDAGMNDLIRPALYGAQHFIEVERVVGKLQAWDLHGPVCESSDCFGKGIMLPPIRRGDRIRIHAAGAYVASMASSYNCRPLLKSVSSVEAPIERAKIKLELY